MTDVIETLARALRKAYESADIPKPDAATTLLAQITPALDAAAMQRMALDDKSILALIDERDYAQGMADKLAYAIGGDAIGEHSNLNRPWANALEIAQARTPLAEARKLPEVQALVEACDNLLEAILAENKFRDRALTITGPTANLKWLVEAEDDARAALRPFTGEARHE